MLNALRIANLSLLILFPIAWFAPLMRAGLLPLFGLKEISVISGMQALWDSDVALALLVTFFALFAPYLLWVTIAAALNARPRGSFIDEPSPRRTTTHALPTDNRSSACPSSGWWRRMTVILVGKSEG